MAACLLPDTRVVAQTLPDSIGILPRCGRGCPVVTANGGRLPPARAWSGSRRETQRRPFDRGVNSIAEAAASGNHREHRNAARQSGFPSDMAFRLDCQAAPGKAHGDSNVAAWWNPDPRRRCSGGAGPKRDSWSPSLASLRLEAGTRRSFLHSRQQPRRECQLLSIISSVGYIASMYLVPLMSEPQINRDVMTFMVWFAYLPAVFVVLRRQNEGDDWALLRLGRGRLASVPRR